MNPMPKFCPLCGTKDSVCQVCDANETIVECQWCFAVLTLVVWDMEEDGIHAGINVIETQDMLLQACATAEDAWKWVERNCNRTDSRLSNLVLN